MKHWLAALLCVFGFLPSSNHLSAEEVAAKKVYIVPVRDDIMPPLVYLVRRGVKEAMEAKADVLVIDMETNGGRVDVTEEIIEIINQFKGKTVTYVNKKAFSAGAFISFATQKIYMAPQSVIGAAAPILMSPGGAGTEAMPDTMEAKMTSAISALVRANAEKNGHNVEVADAMVKKTKELKIDGVVLN
jgi:membrane-bound serine protease (ClpP class)